ncbi:Copper-binding periplasmic protein [Cinnamomum micranthum f. kanehirae]|uniref:Copper-binding periplasmic protein n=1 Tax=Cinnamomum micranthum f. kanehirae TaxID=337451 RepID=A0A3S3NT88_9MAGN|nr:Copper-binding periplasmic protein [Cinnamomum micranthum f. kanehirae]
MAVELCLDSPSWNTISPRISFSHDLKQADSVPVDSQRRLDSTLLELSADFDFCVGLRCEKESVSTADELFSNGKILPLQFKNRVPARSSSSREKPQKKSSQSAYDPPILSTKATQQDQKKESLREILANPESDEKPISTKSFWRFNRSSSLNCSSNYRKSLIFSLPLLSRSNSTGSTNPNPRRPPLQKQFEKPLQKPPSNPNPKSQFSGSGSSLQKPPLKKNSSGGKTHFGSHANGVRISPVLNVPPCISKGSTGLFGFGYLFCNGKDYKGKKKSPQSFVKSRSASV